MLILLKMTVIESFTNVTTSNLSKDKKNELYQLLFYILLMKLFFIYLVAYFVWPRVMPQLFSGVNPNPTFIQLLGLSIMISLLL